MIIVGYSSRLSDKEFRHKYKHEYEGMSSRCSISSRSFPKSFVSRGAGRKQIRLAKRNRNLNQSLSQLDLARSPLDDRLF